MIDGNDIWEALFSITEGDVPDGMTEDICEELATWFNKLPKETSDG